MDSPNLALLIILFLSYLIGSFPTSIIMGKVARGIDIREHGSGNAGGTNVYRVLGWKPALIVVLFDIFKGWLPAYYLANIFSLLNISSESALVTSSFRILPALSKPLMYHPKCFLMRLVPV